MWDLADMVVSLEKNLGVLDFFINGFLGATLHHDPNRVESLALKLLQPDGVSAHPSTKRLLKNLGSIVTLLWVSHGLSQSNGLIQSWIADLEANEEPLSNSLFSLRDGLILGYESPNEREKGIRHRCQGVLSQITEAAAIRLNGLFRKTQPDEEDKAQAKSCLKLIDQACMQLFFASGAFKERKDQAGGLSMGSPRVQFIEEVEESLRRIGEVGTPHTIYYLLQLLEFLLPADPTRVFDLMTHSVLRAGRQHGFQFESLGADLVVRMVGQFLADHRGMFENSQKRQTLIECLELFLSAGWPAARRLLYRLPDLLQ